MQNLPQNCSKFQDLILRTILFKKKAVLSNA